MQQQNHFPYLPIVTNPENNHSLYPDGDPDRQQNLIIYKFTGPLPTFTKNLMQMRWAILAQSC